MSGGSCRTRVTAVPASQTAVVPLPAEVDAVSVGLVEAALASALTKPQRERSIIGRFAADQLARPRWRP
jgi:hypothetical protein